MVQSPIRTDRLAASGSASRDGGDEGSAVCLGDQGEGSRMSSMMFVSQGFLGLAVGERRRLSVRAWYGVVWVRAR